MNNEQNTNELIEPCHSTTSLTGSWQQQWHTEETDQCSATSSHDDHEFSKELHMNMADSADATNIDETADENELEGDGTEHSDHTATMTLLPPPPSWFQFEDDVTRCTQDNHTQSTHTARQSNESENEGTKPTAACEKARAPITVPLNQETKNSDTAHTHIEDLESHEELTQESTQLNVPLLPEYNSPEAHMFDIPVSFACNASYDLQLKTEESLSDSISIQSAIDALIAQTLSFTSQTVSKTIPTLLHECSSSAIQKALHKLRIEYAQFGPRKYLRASELGSVGGYFRPSVMSSSEHDGDSSVYQIESSVALGKGKDNHFDWMWMDGREVRFTNLPWIERQLVHEWRTYEWTINGSLAGSECFESSFCLEASGELVEHDNRSCKLPNPYIDDLQMEDFATDVEESKDASKIVSEDDDEEEFNQVDACEYERARTLAPRPLPRPEWEHATSCYICHRTFGPTLHRHHCRRCGHSYCNTHSNYFHQLPHLGYDRDVRERVCRGCKVVLDSRDLEERVAVSNRIQLTMSF